MDIEKSPSIQYFESVMNRNAHIVPVGLCIMQFVPNAQDPFYAMPISKVLDVDPLLVLRDIRRFETLGMVATSDFALTGPAKNARLYERTDHELWGNFMEEYGETEGIGLVEHLVVKGSINLEVQP